MKLSLELDNASATKPDKFQQCMTAIPVAAALRVILYRYVWVKQPADA